MAPLFIATAALLSHAPIAQDPEYHHFADQRAHWGIPHFGDVVSNAAFVVVGLWGLASLRKTQSEARSFALLFGGVLMTGFGSAYYHWAPDSATLFWDRMPMAIAFMALFSVLLSERVNPRLGRTLLVPLVLAGMASVWYWSLSDDLRFYALVQFYPMIAFPILMLFWAPRYSHSYYYWWMFGGYALAKAFEAMDGSVFELNGLLTGHNLKHLAAALSIALLLRMLHLRRRLTDTSDSPVKSLSGTSPSVKD